MRVWSNPSSAYSRDSFAGFALRIAVVALILARDLLVMSVLEIRVAVDFVQKSN